MWSKERVGIGITFVYYFYLKDCPSTLHIGIGEGARKLIERQDGTFNRIINTCHAYNKAVSTAVIWHLAIQSGGEGGEMDGKGRGEVERNDLPPGACYVAL